MNCKIQSIIARIEYDESDNRVLIGECVVLVDDFTLVTLREQIDSALLFEIETDGNKEAYASWDDCRRSLYYENFSLIHSIVTKLDQGFEVLHENKAVPNMKSLKNAFDEPIEVEDQKLSEPNSGKTDLDDPLKPSIQPKKQNAEKNPIKVAVVDSTLPKADITSLCTPEPHQRNQQTVVASYSVTAEKSVKVGSILSFGKYPQGKNAEVMPIVWQILAVKNNQILVISKFALDCHKYDEINVNKMSWSRCTLHNWLNNDFYSRAFDADAKKSIHVFSYNDRISLLSTQEAELYLPSDEERKCVGTDYSVQQGAYNDVNQHACVWWLRSSEATEKCIIVGSSGKISIKAACTQKCAVRPIMWLDVNSLGLLVPKATITPNSKSNAYIQPQKSINTISIKQVREYFRNNSFIFLSKQKKDSYKRIKDYLNKMLPHGVSVSASRNSVTGIWTTIIACKDLDITVSASGRCSHSHEQAYIQLIDRLKNL